MVIGYDSIFYILFLHDIVVRESKSIFRGAAFLQFRGQKIAADGVSRQAHRTMVFKKLYEQGLKTRACVLCGQNQTFILASIPRNKHWTVAPGPI